MRTIAALALSLLAACSDPSLGVGFTLGSGGVSVSPSVSGRVGDVGVTVSK